MPDEQIAFINGADANDACVSIRLENLKKGEYYILYRPNFKPDHKVRRINVVFYSEFYQ